jgi:hypothetical protein
MGATLTISIREDNQVVHRINGNVNASSLLNGAGIGLRVLNRTNSTDIQMIGYRKNRFIQRFKHLHNITMIVLHPNTEQYNALNGYKL